MTLQQHVNKWLKEGNEITVLPAKKAKGVEKNINKKSVALVGRKAISIRKVL